MRRTLPHLSLPLTAVLGLAGLATGTVTATTAGAATTQYVAMGDAYAGGEGAPADLSGFDVDSGSCHRTALAWPRLLASAKGFSLETTKSGHTTTFAGHIACTDAATDGLTTTTTQGEPAQLTQIASMSPKPQLVTVMVGAADARLRSVLWACRTETACLEAISAARTVTRTKLPARFARTFAQVKTSTKARVIVVGYPQFYASPSTAALSECPGITLNQLAELRAYGADLEAALTAGAKAAGVEFVSTLDVTQGRELCTANPLLNDVVQDGATVTAQSGRPTALGQSALATRVSSYLTRYPKAPNKAPTASFTFQRKAGTSNRVILNASASRDPDGSITSYTWVANGKVIGTGKVLTITVQRGRTQRVYLTVKDNRGATATVQRLVSPASAAVR